MSAVCKLSAAMGLAFAAMSAQAQVSDGVVKIGVLSDMSSLYADIGGPNSVVAIKMAVEDSGLLKKGWKIDVVSGDHQNKPDVGVNIARQWIDNDKVDAIADTPNSGVALAVSNLVKEKNAVLLNSGAASADLIDLHAETIGLHQDRREVEGPRRVRRNGGIGPIPDCQPDMEVIRCADWQRFQF